MQVHTPLADGPGEPTKAARFRQVQAEDRDSLNGLMAEHDGLVQAVVQRQVLGHLPFAEAQVGRVGLRRAITVSPVQTCARPRPRPPMQPDRTGDTPPSPLADAIDHGFFS